MAFSGVSGTVGATGPLTLLHGGAWAIPDAALPDHREGLVEAMATAQSAFSDAVPAIDAVTRIVAALEGHGAFDAGCGAMLNRAGEVELDAGLMEGRTGRYGGVMAVQQLAHPIRVACDLLHHGNGQAALLAGAGAEAFAERHGHPLVANETLICERERQRYAENLAEAAVDSSESFLPDNAPSDTVGAVVRDANGRLAAGTSTGGTPFKWPGRVGDSPLPGAGYYATKEAAACATGWGEAIAGHSLCVRAVDAVAAGNAPQAVAERLLTSMHERYTHPRGEGARAGLLVLPATGPGAWAFTTPRMARGVATTTRTAMAIRRETLFHLQHPS